MFTRTFVAYAVLILLLGCGDKPADSSTPSAPAPNAAAAPRVDESAQIDQLLAELTQSVRKYAMEKQTVPKSLDELVANGYLRAVPAAPGGKTFGITKDLKVYLH